MSFNRWQVVAAAVMVVAIALAYLIDPIVPIFIISVLGLPVAAFLLNRTPRSGSER